MTTLTITEDSTNNLWYTEFTPSEEGVLMIDRANTGNATLNIKVYDGSVLNPILVFGENVPADYACQLNITGVVVRVESPTEISNAVFSGETE